MQIVLRANRSTGAELRRQVEARLRFVLRRLSWLVQRAVVRLSDGPHPHAAKRCEVELEVVGARDVFVSATARDWRASIDDAVARAARLLGRSHRQAHQI